jgi:hypothetical protein
MDAPNEKTAGLSGPPFSAIPWNPGSGAAERCETGKQLCRGLSVLLADGVAVCREAERRQHLVAQIAKPVPPTAIGANVTWSGGASRRENAVSVHGVLAGET